MTFVDRYSLVIIRILLVVLFPFSAIDKIVHWPLALQQANSSFLAHGGGVLLVLGMTVEFVTPALIVFNWYAKPAAFVLAGFCAVTAVMYHNFRVHRRHPRNLSSPTLLTTRRLPLYEISESIASSAS